MLPVYENLKELDTLAAQRYLLSEELLMENAARGVLEFLKETGIADKKIVIAVGCGNNGADGLALSRMLPNACVFMAMEPKTELCKLQFERAKKLGVRFAHEIEDCDAIVDAILGSGIGAPILEELKEIISNLNNKEALKISIDIPSGVRNGMAKEETAFAADYTVTLGAHKTALFEDYAKDFVGEIILKDLGCSQAKYTQNKTPSIYLLEKADFMPPIRRKKSCHKGDFGHLCIVAGEMMGASVIAAKAAFRLGAGLVSVTQRDTVFLADPQIMLQNSVPKNADTIVMGQGLGGAYTDDEIVSFLENAKNCVIDADLFKKERIKEILSLDKNMVLTPHPKEFCELWHRCFDESVTVEELQTNRFEYAKAFSQRFDGKTLVLKGANTVIAMDGKLFIMPYGNQSLAKGGSGDALAGAIGALLAQGYAPLDAAKNGSLAIAFAAINYKGSNYSMASEDLLEGLKWL